MQSGAVDAAFTDERLLGQNGATVQPLFFVRDAMSPKMMQTVLITTAEFGRAHPDTVRALIEARREGLAYMKEHPDEAGEIVAAAYNNTEIPVFKAEIHALLAINYWSDGKLDYDGMNAMVEGLRITGQLKGEVDWAKIRRHQLPAEGSASLPLT